MSDVWTINGASLESMNASGLVLAFRSLGVSTASWSVFLRTPADAAGVPALRSAASVELNGGVILRGWVTGRKPMTTSRGLAYQITVSDAWWKLEKATLTSEVEDGEGETSERPVFVFEKGGLGGMLAALAARAEESGLPVQAGAMSAMFAVPRLTLRNTDYGSAFSDLMKFLADGVMRVDYGTGAEADSLTMVRRADAGTVEVDFSTAIITNMDIEPRIDLQLASMTIGWAERKTVDGKRPTALPFQAADGGAGDIHGIIAVTGPEISLTLPQDFSDTVEVQSEPFGTAESIARALQIWHDLLKASDVELAAEGSLVGAVMVALAPFEDSVAGITTDWPEDTGLMVTDEKGEELDLEEWTHYLSKGEIRDWFEKDGIEAVNARVTAVVCESTVIDLGDTETPEDPKWARVLGARRTSHFMTEDGLLKTRVVWQASVSTVIPLVKTFWEEPVTLIRKEDWSWFSPPPGLAANLLACQNWLPWQGRVTLHEQTMPHGNPVGMCLNVANWVPETAAMRALITGCTIRPATGEITYDIGSPARHSFLDLAARFRQSGADNIYWLIGGGGDGGSGGDGGDGSGPDIPTWAGVLESGETELTEDGQVELTENG